MAPIAFARPAVDESEVEAVAEVIRSGWLSTGGQTAELESELASLVGSESALGVNSCTAALHLALMVSGVGPGDEVITTPNTFCATANVIEHLQAKPIFVDVDPETLNLDARLVESAITERTKAILPVHFAGHPCDMDPINEIASSRGIPVIEDAAHALPAAYKGRPIGSSGNLVCFSFYATKNVTTGEGGMLVGPSALVEEARPLALHGMTRDAWRRYQAAGSWRYDVSSPGWKYNMTDLAAAMGRVQLRKLARMQERRKAIHTEYERAFHDEPALELPTTRANVDSAHHLFVMRIVPDRLMIDRDEFVAALVKAGISSSVHFIPIHTFSYYQNKYGYVPDDFPVAWSNFQRMFSIPLHPLLTNEEIAKVIEAISGIVERHRT